MLGFAPVCSTGAKQRVVFYSAEYCRGKVDAIMLLSYQRLEQRCITALKRQYIHRRCGHMPAAENRQWSC